MRILIEQDEYLQRLLNEIGKERFIKAAKEDRSQDFLNGAIFGLSWAGNLTSQCVKYVVEEEQDEDS